MSNTEKSSELSTSEQMCAGLRYCGLCESSGYDPVPNEDGTQADCRRCGGRQSLEWQAATEIERLRGLLRECLEAWEGSGPGIVLDRIREALQ